jgi:hypothetical protein
LAQLERRKWASGVDRASLSARGPRGGRVLRWSALPGT